LPEHQGGFFYYTGFIHSFQRSFPSLDLSPTPVNTEYPPCSVAMFLISSIISTVLPTPAPPNRPIFPPWRKEPEGRLPLFPSPKSPLPASARQVRELLCEWRICCCFHITFAVNGFSQHIKHSSKTSLPTGTFIGSPVSTPSCPFQSSVEFIDTHLTVSFPVYCITSATISMPSELIFIALYIEGSFPLSTLYL